ncbi:hypothetical protein N0V87_002985 [Didymella glomerata]|uniref:Uncharacterized protein n=1 Tax=Didymella glomerata TaxID=749621 RepID=A0A9W8X330_9PLEO|nr:hypothetical protein N0V87_002985 [Didymella glomerata]
MLDSPDECLDDFWPLGNGIAECYGPDETLYYRPSTPLSDSDEEEALISQKRFDTAMAGTKHPRTSEQGRRTATRNPPTKDSSSGGDDNSDDDDDPNASLPVRCGGPKPNSPADDSPAARVETHDEKIDQVQIPVGTKLARSLRDLEWKAAVATFSGITMIKNTLGYNNDEAEVVYPQFSSGKGDMTPDLPSGYRRVSLNDDMEATRKRKAKHPTVEDSNDLDLAPTAKPSRAQAPPTVAPVLPESLPPVQTPSRLTAKRAVPSDEYLVSDYVIFFTRESEARAIRSLRAKGFTVTSPGRARSRSEENDKIWEQALNDVERVKHNDIRLVSDPDEEVRQVPVMPRPKRRSHFTRQMTVQPRSQKPVHPRECQEKARRWADLEQDINRWRPVTLGNQQGIQAAEKTKDAIKDKGQKMKNTGGQIENMGDNNRDMGVKMRRYPNSKSRRRPSFDSLYDSLILLTFLLLLQQ